MLVIPAVDVLGGAVVRLFQGDYGAVTTYSDDPVTVVSAWGRSGASIIHVVDLDGARSGVPSPGLTRSLGDTGVPFQIGGGIRDGIRASEAVNDGAAKIVVGSAAVHDGGELASIVEAVGSSAVVAAIDVRAGKAVGSGWLDSGAALPTVVDRVVDAGVRTALVTGIERDGAMDGPNTEILETVRGIAPDLSLIASGGVGSLDDLAMLRDNGYEAAIVGRALYENRFTLEEAMETARSFEEPPLSRSSTSPPAS
ncbi:MAG: 1-(5-phosphoribosyl)-5-[(5-phosphoribosylamino)methylideneamino] imidazole-4-carboxamide isomerase [Actinomycetota bacterium]